MKAKSGRCMSCILVAALTLSSCTSDVKLGHNVMSSGDKIGVWASFARPSVESPVVYRMAHGPELKRIENRLCGFDIHSRIGKLFREEAPGILGTSLVEEFNLKGFRSVALSLDDAQERGWSEFLEGKSLTELVDSRPFRDTIDETGLVLTGREEGFDKVIEINSAITVDIVNMINMGKPSGYLNSWWPRLRVTAIMVDCSNERVLWKKTVTDAPNRSGLGLTGRINKGTFEVMAEQAVAELLQDLGASVPSGE